MQLEPWVPLCVLFDWWFSPWGALGGMVGWYCCWQEPGIAVPWKAVQEPDRYRWGCTQPIIELSTGIPMRGLGTEELKGLANPQVNNDIYIVYFFNLIHFFMFRYFSYNPDISRTFILSKCEASLKQQIPQFWHSGTLQNGKHCFLNQLNHL